MTALAWLVALPLLVLGGHRCVLLAASLLPRRAPAERRDRTVTILTAARNEEARLPALLAALDRVDYPRDRLRFVIVSDGSRDRTAEIAERWAATTAGAEVITLPTRHGKAAALDAARRRATSTDLVAVLDADAIPEPAALARLVGAFDDPGVGAACGYPDPGTDLRTVVARYGAVERWTTHLVTLAGRDRLGLQPAVIGAFFCVRREALDDAGGFVATTTAEDIELTQRLHAAGWRTRWIGEARATEQVPADAASFRAQRCRWTRGLWATARSARSIEDFIVALAYSDRLLVLGAIALTATRFATWLVAVLAFYAITLAATVMVAIVRADPPRKLRILVAIAAMAALDVAVTIGAAVSRVRGSAVTWSRQAR